MNERAFFVYRFPEKIPGLSLLKKLVIISVPLFFLVHAVLGIYYAELIILSAVSLFLIPLFRAGLLDKSARMCETVLYENADISGGDASGRYALLVDGAFAGTEERSARRSYIQLILFIMLYVILLVIGAERPLRFQAYTVFILLFSYTVSALDQRDILRSFRDTVLMNAKRLFSGEASAVSSWPGSASWWDGHYRKWGLSFVSGSFVAAVMLALFFGAGTAPETLVVVVIVLLAHTLFMDAVVEKAVNESLSLLRRYDDRAKEAAGLVHRPELRGSLPWEKIKAGYRKSLKRNGYEDLMAELRKDVRDVFK